VLNDDLAVMLDAEELAEGGVATAYRGLSGRLRELGVHPPQQAERAKAALPRRTKDWPYLPTRPSP
jgi:hypothetical protein